MTTKAVERLDGVEEQVTKQVEVSKLVEPQFLTLTGRPANEVAFKIVRTDGEETSMTTETAAPARVRRVRTTQRSALLTVIFPEGCDAEQAAGLAEEYGLEGYEMVTDADTGRVCLRRSDLTTNPTEYISVGLGNGVTAHIAPGETITRSDSILPAIAVVAIEFNKSTFADEAAALAVIERYDIDFLEKGVENTDSVIRVLRSEVQDTMELRRIEVEPGVVAVITRADAEDMGTSNAPFISVVSETAYGCYGWGQLDFNAMMADVEYCEAADTATYKMRWLMDSILFNCELPLAARKELVKRAAEQYVAYIGALIDGLPSKVVLINRSEKTKEQSMKQTNTEQKGAASQETPAAGDTPLTITRSELQQMIAEGVTAAMAAAAPAKTEEVARSDEAAGEAAKKEEDSSKGTLETICRSVGDLAESLKGIGDRLTQMEGATIARSDSPDNAVATPEKRDVFAGVLSGKAK